MKHLDFAASYGIALLVGTVVTLSSCSEEVMNPENEPVYASVNVKVNEFSVSMEDFPSTRAAESPADYTAVGAITLAFYDANGVEVEKTTQYRSELSDVTTFGQFSFTLPIGNYTLVALAYKYLDGDVLTLTSPTSAVYTSATPRETFCTTRSVTITSGAALDLSLTLYRVSTWLAVKSTDKCPVAATKVRTTYTAAGKGFNPTTGLATGDAGFSVLNSVVDSIGRTININSSAFLTSNEQVMDITLQVLDDDDHVLITKEVENVPLMRNRITLLKGRLFTSSTASAASFTLETEPISKITVMF
jgi:hypothetical protein